MIFKPGLIEKILSGKKTQTRRALKPRRPLVCATMRVDGRDVPTYGEVSPETACQFIADRTTTRYVPGCRYVPGRDYAIKPGRTAAGVARVLIRDVRLEVLGDITPEAAIAEGFKRTDDFFAYWERLYGSVDRGLWVWAISFELTGEERVRYLGRRTGYTETPQLALAEDPADALADRAWAPPAGWQDGHSHFRRQVFEDERAKELDERLAAALQEAEREGLDINRHRHAIGRRVEALEREIRKAKTRASAA